MAHQRNCGLTRIAPRGKLLVHANYIRVRRGSQARRITPMDRASAVVCSTDLARSQDFYQNRVGLQLSPETIPNHLLFETGDSTSLLVYGRPSQNKADQTQVRFWTRDISADVKALVGRGVVFDELD